MKDSVDDEGYKYEDEEGYDLTDSGYWKRKLRLGERKSEKEQQEKMKKKEEKKQKVILMDLFVFCFEMYLKH